MSSFSQNLVIPQSSRSVSVKSFPTASKQKISTGLKRNLKVFGSFKRHKLSASDDVGQINEKNDVETITGTRIDVIIDRESKNDDQCSQATLNITQKLDQSLMFAIVFPFIICDGEKILQPILVKLQKSIFYDNGINLPFGSFSDMKINCFKFKVKNYFFRGRIMALGDSPLDLKVCLQENLLSIPIWKGLPKMKRIEKGIIEFSHCPLEDEDDIPSYRVLNELEAEDLFSSESNFLSERNNRACSKIAKETESSNNNENRLEQEDENKKMGKEDLLSSASQDHHTDLSSIDSTMEKINSQIADLNLRKNILSKIDTTGCILISIINVLDDFRKILDLKKEDAIDFSTTVPQNDLTYKISIKNQIFLEGLIQLDLDLYEAATRQAKPNNPASLAYSIVKLSFPKSYFEDVVLGKKFYDKKEFNDLIQKVDQGLKIKYPLAFIWSFKDPFEAKLEGKSDHKLGHERIRAFFNHIFRKSKILVYSKEAERTVRRRMMKELCALNNELSRKIDAENVNHDHSYDESRTFNFDCFDDLVR